MDYPRYRCHKVVEAVKIKAIKQHANDVGFTIVPEDESIPPFDETFSYCIKHAPAPGGYWVRYEDGYTSFSPAAAFESGYHPIGKSSVELNVDLGSLLICSCGYALLPTEKEHVFLHPIVNPVNEKQIECEHAGKKYRAPQVPVYLEEAE